MDIWEVLRVTVTEYWALSIKGAKRATKNICRLSILEDSSYLLSRGFCALVVTPKKRRDFCSRCASDFQGRWLTHTPPLRADSGFGLRMDKSLIICTEVSVLLSLNTPTICALRKLWDNYKSELSIGYWYNISSISAEAINSNSNQTCHSKLYNGDRLIILLKGVLEVENCEWVVKAPNKQLPLLNPSQ